MHLHGCMAGPPLGDSIVPVVEVACHVPGAVMTTVLGVLTRLAPC